MKRRPTSGKGREQDVSALSRRAQLLAPASATGHAGGAPACTIDPLTVVFACAAGATGAAVPVHENGLRPWPRAVPGAELHLPTGTAGGSLPADAARPRPGTDRATHCTAARDYAGSTRDVAYDRSETWGDDDAFLGHAGVTSADRQNLPRSYREDDLCICALAAPPAGSPAPPAPPPPRIRMWRRCTPRGTV